MSVSADDSGDLDHERNLLAGIVDLIGRGIAPGAYPSGVGST
jgi:hypothetical protein